MLISFLSPAKYLNNYHSCHVLAGKLNSERSVLKQHELRLKMDINIEIPLIAVSLFWLVVGGVVPFVIPKV